MHLWGQCSFTYWYKCVIHSGVRGTSCYIALDEGHVAILMQDVFKPKLIQLCIFNLEVITNLAPKKEEKYAH